VGPRLLMPVRSRRTPVTADARLPPQPPGAYCMVASLML